MTNSLIYLLDSINGISSPQRQFCGNITIIKDQGADLEHLSGEVDSQRNQIIELQVENEILLEIKVLASTYFESETIFFEIV